MNKIVNNSLLYTLQIGITGFLMLILISIFSNYLTPSDLGVFVLAQVYSGIAVGIANFGMLIGYERNFFIFEKSQLDSARLTSTAVIFVTFNLIVLVVLLYIFQPKIADLIFDNKPPDNMLMIVLIGASVSSISQYYLTFLKNTGMALSYVKHSILSPIIYFVVSILLMTQFDLGLMSMAYGWSVSNLILIISLFIAFRKSLIICMDFKMLKDMLKISLPLTPRVFFGVINAHLDKIILDIVGSTALVGAYHIGNTFSLTIFQFSTALGKVFQPELYRKLFAKKHIENPDEINNYMLPFFYISIFMALVVMIFSKEIINAFISSNYSDVIPVTIILSLYYAFLFFGKMTGTQLIYAKKTHITTLLMFLGMAINIGLNIPFIMMWGIIDAAWATTISGILTIYIGYFVAQKYAKIIWLWRTIFLVYSIFILGAVFALIDYSGLITLSSYISIMIKLLIIMIYFIVGLKINIFKIIQFKKLLKIWP